MRLAAHTYYFCQTTALSFRGKRRLSEWAKSRLNRGSGFFPWLMSAGYSLAIRPSEATLGYGVAATCYSERRWESHVSDLLGRLLRPGDRAVDIGANIGAFVCRMSQLVGPNGSVVAFEPSRSTFDQLLASIQYSGASNVDARNLALGSAVGQLDLRVPLDVSGNASAFVRDSEGQVRVESVAMSTLDKELNGLPGAPVRLIKLDAEGFEMDILRGAVQTLQTVRPGVLVEWNPETAALGGWKLIDLVDFMRSCGPYRGKLIWREGKLLEVELSSLKVETGGYVDLYFSADAVDAGSSAENPHQR